MEDNNKHINWGIHKGDYINSELDYAAGPKKDKEREKLLSIFYNVGFVAFSLVLMLMVLHFAARFN